MRPTKIKLYISREKVLYIAFVLLLVVSADNYLNKYFGIYTKAYSWSWQYGYRQAVDYIKANYDKYDKIVMTKKYGEPHEFVLFYWPWNPAEYQNDPNLNRFFQTNWYWVDGFDKFYFVNDWQVVENKGQKTNNTEDYTFIVESKRTVNCNPNTVSCLLITSPDNVPLGWHKLETINFLDGKPALEIYKN